MARRVAAVLPVLLLVAALADTGHAQSSGWSAPAPLGASSLYFMAYNGVALASSEHPLAQAVAVWTEPSSMTIRFAVKRNGAWAGGAIYKANATASESVTDPQVVIDPAGNVTVVWGSTMQGPVTYCSVGLRIYRCPQYISYAKSATLAPGATAWTKPANVSTKGWFIRDVQAGMDAAGNITAVWAFQETKTPAWTLQAARRPVAAAWTLPASLRSATALGTPSLAVGSNGDALVGWTETAGTPAVSELYEMSFAGSTGTWDGTATFVASQPAPLNWMRAALAGDKAALAWNDGGAAVWAVRTAGMWGSREVLSGGPASTPQIAGDATGGLMATWLHLGAAPDGGNTVDVHTVAADGAAADAAWPVGTNTPPTLAVSPDGSGAFVTWLDETDYNVYATESMTAGGWTAPVVVSTGATQYSAVWGMSVAAAAGPNHRATLAWWSVAGTNYQIRLLAATR